MNNGSSMVVTSNPSQQDTNYVFFQGSSGQVNLVVSPAGSLQGGGSVFVDIATADNGTRMAASWLGGNPVLALQTLNDTSITLFEVDPSQGSVTRNFTLI